MAGRTGRNGCGRHGAVGGALLLAAVTALAAVLPAPAEAWSSRAERPPRKGDLFYVEPLPRAPNFLVPRGQRSRYFKPQPWTKEWYAYCAARWPSFNPRTGTIVTPDGVRMCI